MVATPNGGGFPIAGMIGQHLAYWSVDADGGLTLTTQGWYWRGPILEPRAAWLFEHEQSCCEHVRIVRFNSTYDASECAQISDARLWVLSDETPSGLAHLMDGLDDSYTWTRLIVTTGAGVIDVLWLGESNGYYSEGITVRGPDRRAVEFDGGE